MTQPIAPMTARVSFRKQVSDGNYGSEVAEVSFDVDAEDAYEVTEEVLALALENARKLVHDELSHSPSANVRRALEQPKVSEDDWRRAKEAAEYELAAGKRDNARDDNDPEDLPY